MNILRANLLFVAVAFSLANVSRGQDATKAASRPNILVIVADDLPSRADPHKKLLLLFRPEKAHLPVPDIQLAGHQPVRLLQPHLPLQICFRVVVHVENDGRLVAADIIPEAANKFLRSRQRLISRHAKIHGSFRKRPKEIFVRKHCAHYAQQDPQQQRTFIRTCQPAFCHQCLPQHSRHKTATLIVRSSIAQVSPYQCVSAGPRCVFVGNDIKKC